MEREASGCMTVPAAPFTHVQVSGKFVRQDQDERLYFLDFPRKLKVCKLFLFSVLLKIMVPGVRVVFLSMWI